MTNLARFLLICAFTALWLAASACGSSGAEPDARPTPTIDGPGVVVPGFGEKCTCPGSGGGNGGDFECSGTNICATGLSCMGQTFGGVSAGRCYGPECCSGKADCAAKLGKQSSCATDQKCVCPWGDLECVGTSCTCEGGVPATRGLCYPN